MVLRDKFPHNLEKIGISGYQTNAFGMCRCPSDGVSLMGGMLPPIAVQSAELCVNALIDIQVAKRSLTESRYAKNKNLRRNLIWLT